MNASCVIIQLYVTLQRSAKVGEPGLVNFITAVAYHFCPACLQHSRNLVHRHYPISVDLPPSNGYKKAWNLGGPIAHRAIPLKGVDVATPICIDCVLASRPIFPLDTPPLTRAESNLPSLARTPSAHLALPNGPSNACTWQRLGQTSLECLL